MQDYIHELGSCLLELDGPQQQHASDRINTLTVEAFTLATHRSRFDGKISRPIMTVEADASNPGISEPDEAFYNTVSPCNTDFVSFPAFANSFLLLWLLLCLLSKIALLFG